MYNFAILFFEFLIYSIIGFIVEVIYCSIIEKKLTFSRGYFIGPIIPIYGFGGILINIFLSQYRGQFLLLFLLGMVICGSLEYFTSWCLEKIFKLRWWDYSNEKHNLDGRICLKNLTHFGIGAIAVVEILNPFIDKYLFRVEPKILIIGSLIFLTLILTDLIVSTQAIASLKLNILKLKNKDATTVIKKGVRRNLEERGFVTKRLVRAFPKLNDLNKYFKKNYFGDLLEKTRELILFKK